MIAMTPIGNKLDLQWNYTDDIFIWNDWALKSFQVTLYSPSQIQTEVNGPFNYKPSPNTFQRLSNDLDYFRIYKVKISAIPDGGHPGSEANIYCMLTNPHCKSLILLLKNVQNKLSVEFCTSFYDICVMISMKIKDQIEHEQSRANCAI